MSLGQFSIVRKHYCSNMSMTKGVISMSVLNTYNGTGLPLVWYKTCEWYTAHAKCAALLNLTYFV